MQMIRRLSLICAVLIALSTAPALAQTPRAEQFSGMELLKLCNSAYDTDYGFCAGYVSAVANAMLSSSISGYTACGHAPVKSQQHIELFQSYAEIFPEMLVAEASTVVAAGIARAFPC